MLKRLVLIVTPLVVLLMNACTSMGKKAADYIITDARIYTADSNFTMATAVAVKDGRFVAVGSDSMVLASCESSRILDARGQTVYPGFNDGHSHFLGLGSGLTLYANLTGVNNYDNMLKAVKQFSMDHPQPWVLGRGWDQNLWEGQAFPDNDKLDKLFPDKPVVLTRIDGHAVLANSKALEMAGITADTRIDGGEIILKGGKPSGVLIDKAADRMKDAVPDLSREQKIQSLLAAQELCLANGLTTVTDAGLDKDDILLIDSLQRAGLLKMRVYAMLNPTTENFEYFFPKGPLYGDMLTVSSVKLYADGALGSRGALLLEPYADAPGHLGLQMEPLSYYDSIARLAYDAGFQVNTHAIGDSANRLVLDVYARILEGPNDRRWRIEHAQVVHPQDVSKFREYSVIPSVQTTHCTSDMDWADERLGEERIRSAYAYQQLKNQNGWLVNGTDFPIESVSPVYTFFAATARRHLDGTPAKGFQMENALTRKEALYSITYWPAKGSFSEQKTGSIEPGKMADMVMLSHDIMAMGLEDLPGVQIKATWINGDQVYGAALQPQFNSGNDGQ